MWLLLRENPLAEGSKKVKKVGLIWGAILGALCPAPKLILLSQFKDGGFSWRMLREALTAALFYAPFGLVVGAVIGWLLSRMIVRANTHDI